MVIVHVHIERTGGVALQKLYEDKFGGSEMLWYNARPEDNVFAPFAIKTANHTENWQLYLYALAARNFPAIRTRMLKKRMRLRHEHSISEDELAENATVITGHFSVNRVIDVLPPDKHEYRTVVRDPLARMWSHYNHWRAHRGNVGQRYVPKFARSVRFVDFAMNPNLHNYQMQAVVEPSYFRLIGVTEKLGDFATAAGLIPRSVEMPVINHFGNRLPDLDEKFIEEFKAAHSQDYILYRNTELNWS